jgi:membrane fusion protein (multidrug efflux system)
MHFFLNKFLPAFVGLAVLAGTTSCGSKKKEEAANGKKGGAPKTLRAEGYVVKPDYYASTYTASGSLLPNEEVDIHPETAGRVTNIFFKEGTVVHKGQILVQLYDADIKASIQKLRAQRALQVKILDRQEELVKIGGISRQDYETAQTQIQSTDADIAYQQALLAKTKIVAPFDGRIGIRNISPGAVITTTTLVATLQQTHPLKIDFTVPDEYRSKLENGMKVQFTVDGRLDTLSGTISALDPGADMSTRTLRVRAQVPNADGKLTAGSFAHVVIPFASENNAILIPTQAVIPTTRDKKVAVVKAGKVNLSTVILGDRTPDKVLVLQGVNPGDTIITTGLMQVKQDMEVKITKVQG